MAGTAERLLDCRDLTAPPSTLTPSDSAAWQAAGWGLAATIAAAVLSYAFQILVARFMSPTSYSDTVAMLSLYMVCSLPLTPIFLLVTRRVAEARRDGRPADIAALVRTLLLRGVAAGVPLLVIAFVARAPLAGWLRLSEPLAIPIFALSIFLSALHLLVVAVLLGRMDWRAANGLPVLFGISRIVLSLVLVRPGFEVAGTFAAITGSAAVTFTLGLAAVTRGLGAGGRYHPLHLGEVALAIVLNAAFWFLVQVDTIYVNRALPLTAEAGFVAASGLAKMLVYVPMAVGNVMFPLLSAAPDPATRRRMLGRMLLMAAGIAILGLLVMAAAPEPILLLTLGRSHVAAADYLLQVGLVLAPLSLVGMFLYDALARHDRVVTAGFAAAAAMTATALVVMTPSVAGLYAALLAPSAVALVCGAIRAWGARS
jgi:O-antigen/teichoic acid export membrane protein